MPIYKNKKRNTWFVSFYYTDWTGKRKRKKKEGFKTKREAMDYECNFLETKSMQCMMKFNALTKAYLNDCEKRIKLSSYVTKKSIIKKYILPFFHDRNLNDISPVNIRQWQSWILENYPTKTNLYLRNINTQLSCIFNYAKKYYKLNANPVNICGDKLGDTKKTHITFWTATEFGRFIKAVNQVEPINTIFNLLFWTGIRRGELLALRPMDFNFKKKHLRISRNMVYVKSKPHLSTPKTNNSERIIIIPDFLVELLKKYIKDYKINDDELMFKILPSYLMENIVIYSAKANLKPIKVHDFRHSHASLLIEMGFSPLVIAQRLGHKDINTTLRIYTHLYPSKQQKLAEKLHVLYKNTLDEQV